MSLKRVRNTGLERRGLADSVPSFEQIFTFSTNINLKPVLIERHNNINIINK